MSAPAPYAYHEDVNWGLLRLWGERTGQDVLDIGCGFATTSARIEALGNRVTGIELSEEAHAKAGMRLSRLVKGDIQDLPAIRAQLPERSFDALILADVLEHIAWPEDVLRSYLTFLRPGGRVFVSLPNVGIWSVRLALLAGFWNYQDTGVMDRTHLRFFTRSSAARMLETCGLRVVRKGLNPGLARPLIPLAKRWMTKPAPGHPHDTEALLNSRAYQAYLRWIHPGERLVASVWPGFLAFQMLFEAEQP